MFCVVVTGPRLGVNHYRHDAGFYPSGERRKHTGGNTRNFRNPRKSCWADSPTGGELNYGVSDSANGTHASGATASVTVAPGRQMAGGGAVTRKATPLPVNLT
jgi:hypothetical protein